MIRAASVGLGWWSDELAQVIQGKSREISVVSCASRSVDKRAAFARKFGTGQHETFEAVLADPEIDAVILTTPHSLHAGHVIQAAAAGKHAFVEKPLSLTVESGRAAARACAEAGVVLGVGHNRRFAPAAVAIREMLDAGEFGTVLHAEANFSAPGGLSYKPDSWRSRRAESPGGGIAGLGIHMIDTLTWLLGRVVRTTAQARRRALSVDLDDTTSALFEFESGATGYLGTMMACPYTSTLNLYGTMANAFAQLDGDGLSVQRMKEQPEPRTIAPIDTLAAELEEFARGCAGGGQAVYRIAPGEAVHDVEVMEAMVASAEAGGKPVTISEETEDEAA